MYSCLCRYCRASAIWRIRMSRRPPKSIAIVDQRVQARPIQVLHQEIPLPFVVTPCSRVSTMRGCFSLIAISLRSFIQSLKSRLECRSFSMSQSFSPKIRLVSRSFAIYTDDIVPDTAVLSNENRASTSSLSLLNSALNLSTSPWCARRYPPMALYLVNDIKRLAALLSFRRCCRPGLIAMNVEPGFLELNETGSLSSTS